MKTLGRLTVPELKQHYSEVFGDGKRNALSEDSIREYAGEDDIGDAKPRGIDR